MPRPLRVQGPGVFHVMGRGVARQPLFRDAEDRWSFMRVLEEAVGRHEWTCHAFCLMTTHYHVLVRVPDASLAAGMQRVNGHYASSFNRRHGGRGHVFERRYVSVPVVRESHAVELSRYFALNPVRAGLCKRPASWLWSSYRFFLGIDRPPSFLAVDWLLLQFGGNRERARARFRSFVEG